MREGLFSAVSLSEETGCLLQISAPQLMRADTKPSYASAMGDGRRGCLMVMSKGRLRSAPEIHALASGEWVKTLAFNLLFPRVGKVQESDFGQGWVRHLLKCWRLHKPWWSVGSHGWLQAAESGHPGVSWRGRFQMP